jgi:hypothetical protein
MEKKAIRDKSEEAQRIATPPIIGGVLFQPVELFLFYIHSPWL